MKPTKFQKMRANRALIAASHERRARFLHRAAVLAALHRAEHQWSQDLSKFESVNDETQKGAVKP